MEITKKSLKNISSKIQDFVNHLTKSFNKKFPSFSEKSIRYLEIGLSFFCYCLVKAVFLTYRIEIVKSPEIDKIEYSGKPLIYVFWHGRLFPMAIINQKNRNIYAIISRHGDGEIIANFMRFLGVKTIRGSSNRPNPKKKYAKLKNKGGVKVIMDSIKVIEQGDSIVLTPDGPKGPRYSYKPNSIKIASLTGAPIIPLSFSGSFVKIFKSWDKFVLPLPFAKVKFTYGDAHYIPKVENNEDLNIYAQRIENNLNEITSKLDKEFGLK
jgi:lysophospholipid acyltransferase (LPLAT)-like uncharacterized protein